MAIQLGGLGSGLDTNALVQQLMSAERQPVTTLETRKVKLQAIAAAFTALNGRLGALQAQVDGLRDPAAFLARSVTSSVETVATATAAAGNTRGTFTLTVTNLARGSAAAAAVTRSAVTDVIAAGADSFDFRLGAAGATVQVAVDGTTTLEGLARAINDKNAGVRATLVNAGTEAAPAWKLTLTSTATGAASDIVVVHDGTTLGIANTQEAKDAVFSVSGLGSFSRATNTFSDVIEGVTVTLKGGGQSDLSVGYDGSATRARLQGLIDAYNEVVRAIDTQTVATKGSDGKLTGGAFSGDVVPRQIRLGLAADLRGSVRGSFQALAEIGVTTQKDGSLALDGARFQKAFADDPGAIRDLVAGTATQDGIADRLARRLEDATRAVSGTIASRRDGLTATIRGIQQQIDRSLDRLEIVERGLRLKFNNLEQVMARLQQTGSSLASQLSALNARSASQR